MIDAKQEKIVRKYQQCIPLAFMMSGSGWIVPVQQDIDWRYIITIMLLMDIPQVDRMKHIAKIASNFAFLQELHCNAAHIIEISAPLSVKWGNQHLEGQMFVFKPSEVAEPKMNPTYQIRIVDTPLSEFVGKSFMENYLQNFFNGVSCMLRL
jgi:hypothetical protein